MEKRYQVFVSSTFRDLEDERREVIQALLELDCIPSGMELFQAGNDDQWTIIKRIIDDCDYYVVIIGGRYGSIGPQGISYTEMEYRYALQEGKPIIAFLHKDPTQISAAKSEETKEGKKLLEDFRELASQKMIKYWSNAHELGSVVSRSMIRLIRDYPAVGWVRANDLTSNEANQELLQLRRKIDKLNEELEIYKEKYEVFKIENLADINDLFKVSFKFKAGEPGDFLTQRAWLYYYSSYEFTWIDMFGFLASKMSVPVSEQSMKTTLSNFIKSRISNVLVSEEEHKGHDLGTFLIENESFQIIKAQFQVLKWIEPFVILNEEGEIIKDSVWQLTLLGKKQYFETMSVKK